MKFLSERKQVISLIFDFVEGARRAPPTIIGDVREIRPEKKESFHARRICAAVAANPLPPRSHHFVEKHEK